MLQRVGPLLSSEDEEEPTVMPINNIIMPLMTGEALTVTEAGPFEHLIDKDISKKVLTAEEKLWLAAQMNSNKQTAVDLSKIYNLKPDTLRKLALRVKRGLELHGRGGRPSGSRDKQKRKPRQDKSAVNVPLVSPTTACAPQSLSNLLTAVEDAAAAESLDDPVASVRKVAVAVAPTALAPAPAPALAPILAPILTPSLLLPPGLVINNLLNRL